MLEDTAGGGVDDGRLEGGGEAAGRADLDWFRARSSHRDEPRALLVVLHVEGVRGADGGNLGSGSKSERKNHLQDLLGSVHRVDSGD